MNDRPNSSAFETHGKVVHALEIGLPERFVAREAKLIR